MSKALARNTERAITFVTLDKGNPLLYWPSYMRTGNRLTPDGIVVTTPPDEKEQLKRIVEADPLGFLLALMNGQPVPVLHKNEDFDSTQPETIENPRYHVREETANVGMRRDIAQHLLTKLVASSKSKRERKNVTAGRTASIFDAVNERATPAKEDEK